MAGETDGAAPARPPSPAADRTLTVLETLVAAEQPLTLTALAKAARIPLATCAAIVATLEGRGYAQRRVVGRSHYWRPTLRLYGLGAALMRSLNLGAVAHPHLRRLCDELQLPAHLGVLDGQTVVYAAKVAPPGFVQFNTYAGKVAPFHLTALGRAIVAYLPPDEVALLLDRLPPGHGPKARGNDPRWLLDQLAQTRVRGYAVEDEEEQAQIGCVAAPVFDAEERVAGAVGVTGFAREVVGERLATVVAVLLREARRLSEKLGYLTPTTR